MHIDTKNDPITETQFKIENPPIICHVKIRQYRPNVDWSIGNLERINRFELMSGEAYLSRSFSLLKQCVNGGLHCFIW